MLFDKKMCMLDIRFSIHLKYPEQPLLRVKPLPNLHNLLHNRKREDAGTEYVILTRTVLIKRKNC